jgi:hypothetical protein
VAALFEQQAMTYALIGGLGVAFRGTARTTEDADFLVQIPAIELPRLLDAMEKAGCQIDQVQSIRHGILTESS